MRTVLLTAGLLATLLTACNGEPDDATTDEPGEVAVPTPGEVLEPAGASIDPAGSRVAVPCHEEWVCLWRGDSLAGVLPGGTATAWVPRGGDTLLLVAASAQDQDPGPGLVLRDADSGREVARVATGDPVTRLVSADDGATLAAVAGERLLVLDGASLAIRTEIPVPAAPLDLALAPDGGLLAVALPGAPPAVVDARTGRALRSLGGPPTDDAGQVTHVAWGPDGGRIATGSERQARVWDPRTGEVAAALSVAAPLGALDFGADDLQVAVAGGDEQALVLWSWAGDGEQVLEERDLYPARRVLWSAGTPSWVHAVSTTEVRRFDLDVPTEQAVDDPPFPEELAELDLRTTR